MSKLREHVIQTPDIHDMMTIFMTEKEKLQQLFDAALKSPTDFGAGPPKRAYPNATTGTTTATRCSTEQPPTNTAVSLVPMQTDNRHPGTSAADQPACAVLDDAASTEMAKLLDEQFQRKARKHRIEAMATAIVFFGLSGGGIAWFVQSPERVEALTSAVREIRSVGDVKAIMAKYQAALDKIAIRGQHIDQVSAAMGVSASEEDEKDPHFDAEMKEMMGGDSKTAGDRGRKLEHAFGQMQTRNGKNAELSTPAASLNP